MRDLPDRVCSLPMAGDVQNTWYSLAEMLSIGGDFIGVSVQDQLSQLYQRSVPLMCETRGAQTMQLQTS